MSVKCIKLANGEELIGDISDDRNEHLITISNAASIHIVPSQNGTMGVAMMPWLSFGDTSKFVIAKEHIMVLPFEPSVEFLNRYNQMFGSGIQIASAVPR